VGGRRSQEQELAVAVTLPTALVDDTAQDLERVGCPMNLVEHDKPG